MLPIITVCTDASFSDSHKIGAWACYIETPDRVLQTGGLIKVDCNNSTDAERAGLAKALVLADDMVDLSKYRLEVFCDNVAALKRRSLRKTPASRIYQEAAEYNAWFADNIECYFAKAGQCSARHVKAHLHRSRWPSGREGRLGKHDMNQWCDHHARKLLRDHLKLNLLDIKA